MSDIRSDIVEEAMRVAEEADREGLSLRLLGGVAIRLRAKDGLHPAFEREYADLDWITPKGTSADAQRFFKALGYEPHVRFNSMYGQERLLFFDKEHDRQVDVLVGTFRMSHEIRLGKRLDMEPLTIPLAELLLTKLQIVELNEKDVRDALALLHDHTVEDADGDSVNAGHIAQLCAADWGLWRTFTANLDSLSGHVGRYDRSEEHTSELQSRQYLVCRLLLEKKEKHHVLQR